MTTICYKDGVLAADTLITVSGVAVGTATKVFRIGEDIFAVAGRLADIAKLKTWDGPDSVKDMGLLDDSYVYWVDAGGILREIEGDTILPVIHAPFHACGAGSSFAIGAMAQGASAVEAVRIASVYDLTTNSEIMSEQLTTK